MLTHPLQTVAAALRKDIGAHAQLIGTGCAQSAYFEAQARSDSAYSMARYLCEHLARPVEDRRAFASACGLGTHFVKG